MSLLSYESFNALLVEFLQDVSESFSEIPNLEESTRGLQTLISMQPGTERPMNTFYDCFSKYPEKIMSKDSSLFVEIGTMPFMESLEIGKLFEESDNETKEAIWRYIQQLFATATTVTTLSADMLQNIESVASSCVDLVRRGEMNEDEVQDPLFIMQQLQKMSGLTFEDDTQKKCELGNEDKLDKLHDLSVEEENT